MHRYLARYTLAQKLLASSLAFLLPLGLLLWFAVSAYNSDINRARTERAAASSLQSLRALAELLPVHQRYQYLALRKRPTNDPGPTAAAIDEAFKSLQASPGVLNRDRLKKAVEEWQALRSADALMGADDSYARHQMLRTEVRNYLREMADSGGLVLDSEIESYYLMDVAALSMPQMQSDLADVLISIDRDLVHGSGSDSDLATFTAYKSLPDWEAPARLREKLATALKQDLQVRGANTRLQQRITPLSAKYGNAAEAFADGLAGLNPTDGRAVAASLKNGEALYVAGSELWQASAEGLIARLDARISSLWWTRLGCVLLSLLAAGFATWLVRIVSRSLSQPLQRVAEASGRIAAGRLDEAGEILGERELLGSDYLPAWTRDETWRLVDSSRAMIRDLKALLNQVQVSGVQVTGSTTQMSAAVAQLEGTVTEQATSTTEIAATSNEIYATVADLARTMETVTRMASEAAALKPSLRRG
jgi:methyl-accepting chemotaxis protein